MALPEICPAGWPIAAIIRKSGCCRSSPRNGMRRRGEGRESGLCQPKRKPPGHPWRGSGPPVPSGGIGQHEPLPRWLFCRGAFLRRSTAPLPRAMSCVRVGLQPTQEGTRAQTGAAARAATADMLKRRPAALSTFGMFLYQLRDRRIWCSTPTAR